MKTAALVLLFVVTTTFAAEQSCVGRCQVFDASQKCQCDNMCKYYGSCCEDFDTTCRNKVARGDTFEVPEGAEPMSTEATVVTTLDPTTLPPTTAAPTTIAPTTTHQAPTDPPDPDAVTCSGRTFDAFMQLKNGTIFAFRGDYFFELDERSVKPGYPKRIKDVWGISGPIDAAFTRINCQGKTYLFKGNKYWRFDGDVLDEDYPRDIAVGFQKIPSDVDAAFAIPAPGHKGKEKVYFFKGDQYYHYEFQHQPSHEECIQMSKSSPSVSFTSYTDMYCQNPFDDLFTLLFHGVDKHHKGPHFISKDWIGIKPPVDAVMVGQLYMSATPTKAPSTGRSRSRQRGRKPQRTRESRSLFWEDFGLDYEERYHGTTRNKKKERGRRPETFTDLFFGTPMEYADYEVEVEEKAMPAQNVYFFKKDKYYRVDLQTKRIDYANPPYPRSIAKYWLGCSKEDSKAEK
ncbi:vitronectin b [Sardina pilchardus]|uniref:vitronectin b n=1 Tax=Sardina pilchardus TaxID=27697 RepID=UPI002E156A99